MNKKLKNIASLLPEGLTEDTVKEIATLVDTIINETVTKRVKSLNTKVISYIRSQVDEIKEQAIRELELENDTFRNAQMFENVRALMSTELMQEDENNAVQIMGLNQMELEEENNVLTSEVNKILEENTKLATVVKALTQKVERLSEEKKGLNQNVKGLKANVKSLEESTQKPFKSSERAHVASINGGDPRKPEDRVNVRTELLSEESMRLMPN